MSIRIQLATSYEACLALEDLQKTVWNMSEGYEPASTLLTIAKDGGIVLVAYEGGEAVGFVFGFIGRTASGRLKHSSNMMGILPEYRSQGLGERLKREQARIALSQGLDLMTWTFDPLQTPNAYLNISKLGAKVFRYYPNLYGEMLGINAGISSDRFEAHWELKEQETAPERPKQRVYYPLSKHLSIDGDMPWIHIEVPKDFQALKAGDLIKAQAYRQGTAQLFQEAFALGFVVNRLIVGEEACYYQLERSSTASP